MDLLQNKLLKTQLTKLSLHQRNESEAPKISNFDTRGLTVKIDTI